MKLRPTGLGIKALLFQAVVVFVHYAAAYSNLYFLLLCFSTSLGICALVWSVRNLWGVEAALAPCAPVPAGQPPQLRLASQGRARDARVRLTLEDGERIEAPLPALPRGFYRVAKAELVSSWPLGFFEASRTLPDLDPIVVYPAPLSPQEGAAGGAAGDDGAPQGELGLLQPSALREYRAGDSMRCVHWRATARRGAPVVAEWEAGCGEGYEFLLDLRAEEEPFEHALRRIAGFADAAREEKLPLTLHTQDLVETFGPGHRPWAELWTYLARVQRMTTRSIAPPAVGTHVVRLPS
ncbi:MAG: DUF58 domain-containing protein [Planctomycetota bacterium]